MGDILLFHAPDGEAWANFLTNKLVSPYYELPIRKSLFNTEGFEFSAECHVQVLLLTPDLLEMASRNATNFLGLIPSRCVVVLLGVNSDEIKICLRAGAQCEHIFACKVCCVTSDSTSITKTLVTIIETFEEYNSEDNDIYAVPPSPKQINNVYKIIPKHITQGGNVYLLLDRKSDSDIIVQCDQIDEGIVSDCLEKVVYSFKLPDNIKGSVDLNILTEDHLIGEGHITVESKLDNMKSLLEDMTNPTQFLCESLGLSTYTSEALDTALTQKIKSKSSPALFKSLITLDDLNVTDEKCNSCWPTILHFAAEYNLIKLTDELLKYPGMVIAATTENCNGLYPSSIAENNGHTEIEKRLVNFVLENKNAIDSGFVDPVQLDLPPPEPHRSTSVKYVNMLKTIPSNDASDDDDGDDNDDYINMQNLHIERHLAESRGTTPNLTRRAQKGQFSGNRILSETDPSKLSFMNRDESPRRLMKERELPRAPYLPNKVMSQSFDNSIEEDEDAIYSVPPPASPLIQPRYKLDVLSDTSSHRSSTVSTASSSCSYNISPVKVEVTDSDYLVPSTASVTESSIDEPDQSKITKQFLAVDVGSKEDVRHDKPIRRNKTIQAKISSFLKRIKPRLNSSLDLPKQDKRSKVYGRKLGSDPGFDSDASLAPKVLSNITKERAFSLPAVDKIEGETERDSGSFSEEEDDKIHAIKETAARKDVKKTKKGEKNGLARKRSVRVTRVLKEETSDAPDVPLKPVDLPEI